MPLDADRYVTVAPAKPGDVVPFPGRPTPLAADGEPVDRFDPYWSMAIADGSVAPPPPPKGDAPAKS